MSRMVFALVAAVVMTVAHTIRIFVKYGKDSQLVRWLLDGDRRAYPDIGLTALISFVVAWVLQPMLTRSRNERPWARRVPARRDRLTQPGLRRNIRRPLPPGGRQPAAARVLRPSRSRMYSSRSTAFAFRFVPSPLRSRASESTSV